VHARQIVLLKRGVERKKSDCFAKRGRNLRPIREKGSPRRKRSGREWGGAEGKGKKNLPLSLTKEGEGTRSAGEEERGSGKGKKEDCFGGGGGQKEGGTPFLLSRRKRSTADASKKKEGEGLYS